MTPNQKWFWALLLCVQLAGEVTAGEAGARFVEVSLRIETRRGMTNTARCIFGTNLWLIEGEFTRNSRDTLWCTGTNIIKYTKITKEVPETEQQRAARSLLSPGSRHLQVGEEFTTIYGPSDPFHLRGIEDVVWLAFCSSSFLKVEGRRILPPITTGLGEDGFTDQTQVFSDALKLPKQVNIYRYETNLACVYEARQSTNFGGWMIPVQFELTQWRDPVGRRTEPSWETSVTVTSIRDAPEPRVPPEVMRRARP